jgi:hypothetical protein
MWQFLKENPFIVGALSGSLAAYLLGLLVSHLRREKRWIGYSIESRNIVKAQDSRVSMRFENRDIRRLDSHTVLVRNIGNRAVTGLPVRITATKNAHIVEHDLDPPDGASFQVQQVVPNEIIVTCDLLNPGEAAGVGLTIADSSDEELRVVARAEGLIVKKIDSRSTTTELLKLLLESSFMPGLVVDLASVLSTGRRLTRR